MASTHASESLSLASCSARARRLFSRASHSASTRRPKRSSKARAVMSAWCCCSVHAAAMASSLSAWSFSSVGAVSIVAPSLVVVPPTEMFGRSSMAVELDVIVDVDTGTDLPLAVDEGLRRQRAERGLIQPFEKVAAAGAVEPHRPRVEIREELGDPGVEGGQGEEGLVPEAGEDPPLRDLHGDFDLRLVPGLRRPRREDDRAVVAPVT